MRVEKAKSVVTPKEPIRCKLEIENHIEQIMSIKNLGISYHTTIEDKNKINDSNKDGN